MPYQVPINALTAAGYPQLKQRGEVEFPTSDTSFHVFNIRRCGIDEYEDSVSLFSMHQQIVQAKPCQCYSRPCLFLKPVTVG